MDGGITVLPAGTGDKGGVVELVEVDIAGVQLPKAGLQVLPQLRPRLGVGLVAMKGMAGGLISNGPAAAAWMARQEGVAPIWGVQHEWELDQFLAAVRETPAMTPEYQAVIDKDRAGPPAAVPAPSLREP